MDLTGKFLLIAVVGVALLLIGLLKKVKFIIKLGIVIAVVAFVATGGLAVFLPMLQ